MIVTVICGEYFVRLIVRLIPDEICPLYTFFNFFSQSLNWELRNFSPSFIISPPLDSIMILWGKHAHIKPKVFENLIFQKWLSFLHLTVVIKKLILINNVNLSINYSVSITFKKVIVIYLKSLVDFDYTVFNLVIISFFNSLVN